MHADVQLSFLWGNNLKKIHYNFVNIYINADNIYCVLYWNCDFHMTAVITVYYLIIIIFSFFCAPGTQFPRAEELRKGIERVWNGHGADSEIGNVSARQAALKRWTATDKRRNRKLVSRGSVVTSVERLPIWATNSWALTLKGQVSFPTKSKMAAAAILKIHFNGHNSVVIACIYTKFGSERKTDAWTPGDRNTFKFHFYENPRWRQAAILKTHKSP